MPQDVNVERVVAGAVAAACRIDAAALGRDTRMSDLEMDSLSFVSILARIEAELELELGADDTLRLLATQDVGELVAAVSGMVSLERDGGNRR